TAVSQSWGGRVIRPRKRSIAQPPAAAHSTPARESTAPTRRNRGSIEPERSFAAIPRWRTAAASEARLRVIAGTSALVACRKRTPRAGSLITDAGSALADPHAEGDAETGEQRRQGRQHSHQRRRCAHGSEYPHGRR